jgi:hypothetical protein
MGERPGKNPPGTQMDSNMAAERTAQPFIECNGSQVGPGTLGDFGLQVQDAGFSQLHLKILEKCFPPHGASVGAAREPVNSSTIFPPP